MDMERKATPLALLVALLCASVAHADEFVRGDYRFSTGPEPAFVQRAEVAPAWPAGTIGADDARWRYWLYDLQSDHRGGHDVTYVDMVSEVRTASLLGEAGRVQIDFMPDFQRLAIHRVEVRRDGHWTSRLDPARISLARREGQFEQDIANGAVTALVVLDDVRVGDVVRVAYSLDGANPMLAGQDTDWFHVAYHNPVLDLRSRFLYPPGTRLATHLEGTADKPAIASAADGMEVRYRRRGVGGTVDQGNHPRWYQVYPAFQVGPERRWADVVAWALPLYPDVTGALPADLESRIDAWRRLPDASARLTAAVRAVQDEVRYFGIEMGETTHKPHAPADTWSRRYGDCKDKAYLLSTLLRRLDIPAVPALVSYEDGKAVQGRLPGADAFDHVIVRARMGDETVWIDPTIAQQGGDPRRYDLSALGVALPVLAGTTALEAITRPTAARDGVDAVESFESNAAGDAMTFNVDTTYRGASADRARRGTLGERPEDLSRRYLEYYAKRFPHVEAEVLPVVEDDRAANVVRVHERYRLASPFSESGGNVRTLDGYAEAIGEPATLPASMEHSGPLLFGEPGDYRHEIRVTTPASWSAKFGNESTTHVSPAFRYARSVDVTGPTTKVVYELHALQPDVAPSDVRAHLDALRAVRDELSISLRYQLPAALGAKQREDRLKALLRDAMNGDPAK